MAEPGPVARTANRQSAIDSRYLSQADEIARVFKTFRDHRADLQLRFEGGIGLYSAKVLDLEKKTMLLEDIHPRDGLTHLRAGKRFALSGRLDGMYIHSASNVAHKADAERGLPYFHVALPESLLYQQRRKSARFRLPLRVAANGAQLLLFRKGSVDLPVGGKIIDISAGGCRVQISGMVSPPLSLDEVLVSCTISIPNLLEVNSKGTVRHTSVDEKRQVTSCGVEFTEMQVTDRRRLEQFVQAIAKLSQ